MSRPGFLADHDLNEHMVFGVQRREPAAVFLRARDIGLQDAGDDEVLDYAAREGFIVVSHDVNTMPAHAYARVRDGRPMAGLLMARQRERVGAIIDDLVGIWTLTESDEWHNHVCFLPLR